MKESINNVVLSLFIGLLLVYFLEFNIIAVLLTTIILYHKDILNIWNNYDFDNTIIYGTIRYKKISKCMNTRNLKVEIIQGNLYIDNVDVRYIYLKNIGQLSFRQLLNKYGYKEITNEYNLNVTQVDNKLYINDILVKAIRFRNGKYNTIGQIFK